MTVEEKREGGHHNVNLQNNVGRITPSMYVHYTVLGVSVKVTQHFELGSSFCRFLLLANLWISNIFFWYRYYD
jgi:hypothetical protein